MLKKAFLAGILAWVAPLAPLPAAVIDYNPDHLVTLELSNGTSVTGRIIDVQNDRLQLVRAGSNRLIAFHDLAPTGRKTLGLPESTPIPTPGALASSSSVDSGIQATRERLRTSLERYDQTRAFGYGTYPVVYPIRHDFYPPYYPFLKPWSASCPPSAGTGGWNIQIGF